MLCSLVTYIISSFRFIPQYVNYKELIININLYLNRIEMHNNFVFWIFILKKKTNLWMKRFLSLWNIVLPKSALQNCCWGCCGRQVQASVYVYTEAKTTNKNSTAFIVIIQQHNSPYFKFFKYLYSFMIEFLGDFINKG